mmetsp:Transcript_1564/g.3280  ORF Transcript_1564/g.3280 Transcript_1564/m.3280 type:complete len:219 (+) Transcript_1564:73-729(+)
MGDGPRIKSWWDHIGGGGGLNNDQEEGNCSFSTSNSLSCRTVVDENGQTRNKCERIIKKFRHCPGRAPEEIESTTEETNEAWPRGGTGWPPLSANPLDSPLGRAMDGMFGGGNDGKPPSHGFPSPFGGDPLGSMFGSMMGGMFSEMIDGMRQMDELSKAFEHSFGESLHRGQQFPHGHEEGSPSEEGSFYNMFPRRGPGSHQPSKNKYDDYKKDFTEV